MMIMICSSLFLDPLPTRSDLIHSSLSVWTKGRVVDNSGSGVPLSLTGTGGFSNKHLI